VGREKYQPTYEILAQRALHCEASMDVLLTRVRPLLGRVAHRHAYSFMNDADIEDVVQQALVRIATRLSTYNARHGTRFTTWACRIVLNALRNQHRTHRRRTARQQHYATAAVGEWVAGERAVAQQADEAEELAALLARARAALDSLPEPYRVVMELALGGATNAEIALHCDIGTNTVKSRKSRGTRRLRAALDLDREDVAA
jgi:RNA polymerase sigma factor (sigma-70 family)